MKRQLPLLVVLVAVVGVLVPIVRTSTGGAGFASRFVASYLGGDLNQLIAGSCPTEQLSSWREGIRGTEVGSVDYFERLDRLSNESYYREGHSYHSFLNFAAVSVESHPNQSILTDLGLLAVDVKVKAPSSDSLTLSMLVGQGDNGWCALGVTAQHGGSARAIIQEYSRHLATEP